MITSRKNVGKAAEAVWAANKYFVMACSQAQYRQISTAFRPDQRDLLHAYEQLSEIERAHQTVASANLPELTNALYHMLGYFKKELCRDERQQMNQLITNKPETALQDLEKLTFEHEKPYLMPCRLWRRQIGFNEVPVAMKIGGSRYAPYTWKWYGDHLKQHE
ncbi:DUF1722 domain-containing protein [Natribacillus halophilus]|uniref:DUF1722 domain-containing protein n=1 Tax=Natribacillus halophilus TaxID=549003 RepID=A0A1G8ML81_9BACI|nr:DUF1722 domain-containing protein [Natribacillus halophilus]SDI68663.1 Protein of unknown function [Natribacillus halophilus]